jgi:hypothetical protein
MPLPDQFIHRHIDSHYDSICRLCTRTVAMAKEEPGLLRNEKSHVCDPYHVPMLKKHGIEPSTIIERLYKVSN